MTYQTLENYNATEGFHSIFTYVNDVTGGLFSNMILFTVFLVIAFASYNSQKRLTGQGSFIASLSVAGFITTALGSMMLLVEGLISPYSVLVSFILTIVFVIFLLVGGKD